MSGATIARYRRVIPGFGITLGMTLLWLSLIVLIPLAALFLKTTELSLDQFLRIVTGPRVAHALQLSFGLSLAAAAVNFGMVLVSSRQVFSLPFKDGSEVTQTWHILQNLHLHTPPRKPATL